MTALSFPPLIKPRSVLFHAQNVSRSGGVATNGLEQIVGSGSGRWRASLAADVRSDDQVLAWRAFLGEMGGRSGTALVPVLDGRRVPWPVDAYGRVLSPPFTRDRSLDGTAYAEPEIPAESEIVATASAAAVAAIQIGITISQGNPLQPGNYFGVDSRLYLIRSIVATTGALQTVKFWPGLRQAVSLGAAVLISRPVCEMRFTSDDVGELALDMLRFGTLNLDFVEAF